eukprot:snap_masked-scaffold_133-processed-gene-0.0-mRNA-1 protein AED:1.00 eAED:1.00 QI:0/0/0/0/1/1/2/0/67
MISFTFEKIYFNYLILPITAILRKKISKNISKTSVVASFFVMVFDEDVVSHALSGNTSFAQYIILSR